MEHVVAFIYTTENTSGISTEAEVCCHYLSIHILVYALCLQKRCEYQSLKSHLKKAAQHNPCEVTRFLLIADLGSRTSSVQQYAEK